MFMTLTGPFIISARLMPAVKIGDATISIEYLSITSENRTRYRYHIDMPDAKSFTGSDLKSGVGGGSLQEGMCSLLSFLDACAESYPDGDNADLFPKRIAEWAQQNSDEIGMLRCEIEEQKDLINEKEQY